METEKMPSGNVTKKDILSRIYKLKTALYDDSLNMFNCFSEEKKEGAHDALNHKFFSNRFSSEPKRSPPTESQTHESSP